jgi:predicted HTH domain antitoxin
MTASELRAAHAAIKARRYRMQLELYSGAAVRRKVLLDGTVDEILNQADSVNKAARVIDLLDLELRAIEHELRKTKEAA